MESFYLDHRVKVKVKGLSFYQLLNNICIIKSMKTEELIKEVGREVVMLLLKKNADYGDTANKPPKIFSKLSAKEGILARIDDKLSRIKTVGLNDQTEDTLLDLIGYLILYRVQCKKEVSLKTQKKS